MENKLRSLLKLMEENTSIEKVSNDSFVSLDESMAQNIKATYGGKGNVICGNNTVCSGNGECYNNGTCSNDAVCSQH